MVVGANRDQLGLLIILEPGEELGPQELQDLLAKANEASPSFAQLSNDMCTTIQGPLPKSSKGTIQRGVAYDQYEEDIDRLYTGTGKAEKRALSEMEQDLKEAVVSVAGRDGLELDTDLFNWGVNSLMATRLQNRIRSVSTPCQWR